MAKHASRSKGSERLRLRPSDIMVFIFASQHLDFVEYRPLKIAGVAMELRISQSQAAAAFRRLAGFGYLERGPRQVDSVSGAGANVYRIPYSRRGSALPPSGVDKTSTL